MMTNDEAIKTLREDYCGNRIICELYPDQCNQEDCEIWLAITALAEQPIGVLETQPDGDCISRRVAIDAFRDTVDLMPECYARDIIADLPSAQPEPCEDVVSREYLTKHIEACWMNGRMMKPDLNEVLSWIDDIPSAQPEITQDGTLKVTVDADIANVGRILLSQTGTQRGGLYYKDEQPEETCDTCKHGYFGDGKCDYCRVRYPSHYERRTDGQTD